MHIVCPHCTTSYAIELATLGAAGRTVRCSRCKEVWLARPEDAVEVAAAAPAMAAAGSQDDAADEWERMQRRQPVRRRTRPSSTAPRYPPTGRPADAATQVRLAADWARRGRRCSRRRSRPTAVRIAAPRPPCRSGSIGRTASASRRPAGKSRLGPPFAGLPTACAAMGALVLALVIWRADVVRLLPQTATFYKMVGLEVNLRGLMFKDVKITTETVEGKPVLVIEGVIVGETRKTGRTAAAALQRARRAGRRNLRLERGAGTAGAEARRNGLVQVAPGLAATGRAQYRRTLLQQARYRRRQCVNRDRMSSASHLENTVPRCRAC